MYRNTAGRRSRIPGAGSTGRLMTPNPRRTRETTRPKGILFDAGGTLVRIHADRLAAALRVRGVDPRDLGDAFWRTLVRLEDEFAPAAGEFSDWWSRWLTHLAGGCGVPAHVMVEAYREADQTQHLWDDPLPG